MKAKFLVISLASALLFSLPSFAQDAAKAPAAQDQTAAKTDKEPAAKEKSTAKLTNEVQKVSYTIGADMGSNFAQFRQGSKEEILDLDALSQGLRDAYEGKELAMSEEEMLESMKKFAEKIQTNLKKQYEEDKAKAKAESKAFLEANAKKEGVKTTASGLQYKVIKDSQGKKPGPKDKVQVHYKGSLTNGKVFDESGEEGVTFPIESVIDGWAEGVQLMSEGAKYEFYIPAELAYGEEGQPAAGIMPGAALVFEITLDKILEADADKADKDEAKEEKSK